jgi:hypothetical protein
VLFFDDPALLDMLVQYTYAANNVAVPTQEAGEPKSTQNTWSHSFEPQTSSLAMTAPIPMNGSFPAMTTMAIEEFVEHCDFTNPEFLKLPPEFICEVYRRLRAHAPVAYGENNFQRPPVLKKGGEWHVIGYNEVLKSSKTRSYSPLRSSVRILKANLRRCLEALFNHDPRRDSLIVVSMDS